MPGPEFELPPQYDPRAVEPSLYRRWLEREAFAPKPQGDPYVIVIPPPNVTAVLHVGHGLNNIIQDVLIRFERMRGRAAEWLPGTDHAGIATQNVVEKQLGAEGTTRFDLGREAFVERVWAFVRETGDTIIEQLKIIGCSCDWSRTRFTLDEAYSRSVRETFVTLWEEGLIYRGHRVIHWCPHCLTALSDEEAEHHDTSGNLYHIKYPLADGSGAVTVATTRPETMFGDIGLVYHPEDTRYRALAGKQVKIPLSGIAIPIGRDEAVDKSFGTGMLKVTPAHDANDFDIANRVWPKAEKPLVIREDGTMGEEDGRTEGRKGDARRVPADLAGLDRFDARKKIVKLLEKEGLLVKVEQHQHAVRRCYRCDTVVEPRLSDQWFVKMKPLAEPVLAAYRRGEFRIIPERWRATFENWMAGIRDWNISRQLWWGHRIPVFTCTKCTHQWASRTDPTECPECRGGGAGSIEQDPDVLDTWFSSWLWPFATFGWPQRTADLARFYPGHTLVTAPEILQLWVSRMLMSGYHFMDQRLPFTTVYLTGTVRDTQHRKMSKSLGNGIDPRDVVELYGTDALRWTLIGGGSLGADVIVDPNDLETTFAPGRNFANKLWNIGRFILSQLPAQVPAIDAMDRSQLALADRWILARAQWAIEHATRGIEELRLDNAAEFAFQLAWRDLADWYLEAVKPRLTTGRNAAVVHGVLAYTFDLVLRLLHPVVPFITEELWRRLPGRAAGELLIVSDWPKVRGPLYDQAAFTEFLRVQEAITAIRNIRAEYRIPPKERLAAVITPKTPAVRQALAAEQDTIVRLANLQALALGPPPGDGRGGHAVLPDSSEVFVAFGSAVDVQQECRRLSGEMTRLDQQLAALGAKLTNENFVSRAPADVVAREREKEKTWREQRDVLARKLRALGCS
jgi:valyl-tRNA synthetase